MLVDSGFRRLARRSRRFFKGGASSEPDTHWGPHVGTEELCRAPTGPVHAFAEDAAVEEDRVEWLRYGKMLDLRAHIGAMDSGHRRAMFVRLFGALVQKMRPRLWVQSRRRAGGAPPPRICYGFVGHHLPGSYPSFPTPWLRCPGVWALVGSRSTELL